MDPKSPAPQSTVSLILAKLLRNLLWKYIDLAFKTKGIALGKNCDYKAILINILMQ